MIRARTRIGIADIAVCVAAIVIALIMMLLPASSSGHRAYVKTADSEFYLDITEDRTETVTSNGHTLSLEIKDGCVRISASDCPDKICESTGWLRDSSKVIVCAPAKVLIRIQSPGGGADADFIAGR